MWQTYFQPTNLEEALELLEQYAGRARLVVGGTDVLVELQRGVRPTTTLIDITALRDLKYIREENGFLLLGALATHNDVIFSLCAARSATGASLLGGRCAADSQPRDHCRQPGDRLAGE
jgi:CO/xanthine dehydrogenase FAD-binding subunit